MIDFNNIVLLAHKIDLKQEKVPETKTMFYNNNWPNCPKYKFINVYGFSNDFQQTQSKTNWTKIDM